ncbi:uncharacterized protein LOC131641013 [Vicia villosa]|uniref:uncharacterized protein LOC131641013 n=1 Tax=Vicia villosa TaxID=3911 RepID=UPI00273A978F|nr:uncharacterized protein LOC131641013 [Vicia villosa]
MINGSFNIRGGGSILKRKRVSQILIKGKADIFLIQESKLAIVDASVIKSLWPKENVGWSFSSSQGASGGLITLWMEDSCVVLNSFKGEGYLGIKLIRKRKLYYVVNVYSSCFIHLKRKLWKELLELKSKYTDGEWCLGGDFNAISNSRERRGSKLHGRSTKMRDFADFISATNLIDIGELLGNSLIRDISDHCPIWLSIDHHDWGPRPFRVKDVWFDDGAFLSFAEKEWKRLDARGRSDFVLKEKLRLLKFRLSIWDREVFKRLDLDIDEGIDVINEVDSLLESCKEVMIKEIVVKRSEAVSKLWQNLSLKDSLVMQKSRSEWACKGDLNSRFFHNCLKDRYRRNHLGPLVSEGGMLESVAEIKEEVRNFYAKLYSESDYNRPVLNGISFKALSEVEVSVLEVPFTEVEIRNAVWDCEGSKSLGPDGFNLNFIKKC